MVCVKLLNILEKRGFSHLPVAYIFFNKLKKKRFFCSIRQSGKKMCNPNDFFV